MADIRHRVGVFAPAEQIYAALTTIDGLALWWTRDTRGGASEGETVRFYFGDEERHAFMEVKELVPQRRVAWHCTGGPAEWIDTQISFNLKAGDADGETVVLFTHADWREPVEFMHHCSTKWGQLLLSLKAGLEANAATPFPEDAKISSWS
jgi:uncharacterized protein YndB with AHSA1/START domain